MVFFPPKFTWKISKPCTITRLDYLYIMCIVYSRKQSSVLRFPNLIQIVLLYTLLSGVIRVFLFFFFLPLCTLKRITAVHCDYFQKDYRLVMFTFGTIYCEINCISGQLTPDFIPKTIRNATNFYFKVNYYLNPLLFLTIYYDKKFTALE